MSHLRPSGSNMVQVESFTGRKKVTLTPGHSLMDWIRLGRTNGDLSGIGSNKKPVTLAELAVHNTPKDIWMAIRGKAYNLTPYMEYHPGGIDELMRAAGKDGTELFDEIHNWVNVESMLEKCVVGPLIASETAFKTPASKVVRARQASIGSTASAKPSVACPSSDWYQTNTSLVVVIYTKWSEMTDNLVIVDSLPNELIIEALVKDFSFFVHIKPSHPLSEKSIVTVSNGKIEVSIAKTEPDNWDSLGQPLKMHHSYPRTKNLECRYRWWTCLSNTEVTHDTRLLAFKCPSGLRMISPVGYHIHIKNNISGMEIARSYTVVVPSLSSPEEDAESTSGRRIYLMIKYYKGGAITPWICALKPGEKVQMSSFDGTFDLSRIATATSLILFAAGTGFTSMIRVIRHALFTLSSATFPVKLVFFNKTQKDILWREQLDSLVKTNGKRFSVHHVLSQETDTSWTGLRGRVSSTHVEKFVPKPSEDKKSNPLLLICGQWAYNDSVESLARLHGLTEDHIHIFSQNN